MDKSYLIDHFSIYIENGMLVFVPNIQADEFKVTGEELKAIIQFAKDHDVEGL